MGDEEPTRATAWWAKVAEISPAMRWIGLSLLATLVLVPGAATLRREIEDRPHEATAAAEARHPSTAAGDLATVPAAWTEPVPAAIPEPEPLELDALDPHAPARDVSNAYDCIVEPSEMVEIGSPVEGLIETIHAERGDSVEAGQPLVDLESGVERAQVRLARERARMMGEVRAREAEVQLRKRREDRVGRLYHEEALSLDLREQVETEAEVARRELEEAMDARTLASLQVDQMLALLKRRQIRSPVDGVVVDRLMSVGEVVDEETMLVVARIDPLRVEVVLPAVRFGTVGQGMRAAVDLELPGNPAYVASVVMVDRVIDPASGTFGVWLELPNSDHQIPGGVNCWARFLDE